ncbi:hypothetical protein ACQP1V_16105 [Microtetraspora malaysiensis]|uniref:hypothetical protein n=1 Tax=Microtetraspora malaysiensis TaxID=161358 RepID=UPI003D8FED52
MTLHEHLSGLRCVVCGARDHLWADHGRGIVECRECGQSALLMDAEITAASDDDQSGKRQSDDQGRGARRRESV